jgi:predicted alpha/beta superfamily hydrolase
MPINRRQFVQFNAALSAIAAGGCTTLASHSARTVTITVQALANTATIYLAGNLPSLGPWRANGVALEGDGAARSITLQVPQGHTLEYKFTLGSWDREALGPSGMVMPNHVLTPSESKKHHVISDFKKDSIVYLRDPAGGGVLGRLVVWENFKATDSQGVTLAARHVTVWLPPEYDRRPNERFQVIYAHDGQNLFDPRIANTGTDWGVDESIVRLRGDNRIAPTIVVGLWSTTDRRLEYAPNAVMNELDAATRSDVEREFNGPILGDAYLRLIAEHVKPKVDAAFRTRPEADSTTLMGSSMGGLISLYGLLRMPQVFGRAACLSVHWPVSISSKRIADDRERWTAIITQAWTKFLSQNYDSAKRQRLWVDRGGVELDSLYEPYQRALVPVLQRAGFDDSRFTHRVYEKAAHNEAAWRARSEEVLGFVLAAQQLH